MKTKFTTEQMIEEFQLPWGGNPDVEVLLDRLTDTTRWSVYHELIFSVGGKKYLTKYSVGATKYQEEGPWQDQNEVECQEVHQVKKIVKEWVPVDNHPPKTVTPQRKLPRFAKPPQNVTLKESEDERRTKN